MNKFLILRRLSATANHNVMSSILAPFSRCNALLANWQENNENQMPKMGINQQT